MKHSEYSELIALAAAGALEEHEERLLHDHTISCAECTAELQSLLAVSGVFRNLPGAQASAHVVKRAQALAMHELAIAAEKRQRRNSLVLALVMAWLVTISTVVAGRIFLVHVGAPAALGIAIAALTGLAWSAVAALFATDEAREKLLGRSA